MKILGALWELPAEQTCQFSPFASKMDQIGQIGSAVKLVAPKRLPGFLFFQLPWVPNIYLRDRCPKFETGVKCSNRHRSKRIWVTSLFFCQNDSLMGESLWQKNSLVTHVFWVYYFGLKVKLLLLNLIHLFAKEVLFVKKLKIKETKTT